MLTAVKYALYFFIFAHGFAHLVGFMGSWKIGKIEGVTYSTKVLMGKIDLGHVGIRIYGLFWLFIAVAYFFLVGYAVNTGTLPGTSLLYVSVASLIFSVLGLPEAKIGIPVNLVLLVIIYLNFSNNWF